MQLIHMKEKLSIGGQLIEYTVQRSLRSRSISISVTEEGKLRLSYPWRVSDAAAHSFVQKKAEWILKKVSEARSLDLTHISLTRSTGARLKKETKTLVILRLQYFNQFYGYTYNKITIRNQKSRWGSCSKKGNLNFNYKLAALPAELSDYIVVHELCHLGQFDHSKKFWELVARTIPDWKKKREELRKIRIKIV
jgi:predicted metal-dependent hydrolase